jgi:PAS domain S-box-containing protein
MPALPPRPKRPGRPHRWTAACLICLVWLAVVAVAVRKLRPGDGLPVAAVGFGAMGATFLVLGWAERARWREPVRELTHFLRAARGGAAGIPAGYSAELAPLVQELTALARAARRRAPSTPAPGAAPAPSADPRVPVAGAFLTRSGLFDAPPIDPAGPPGMNTTWEYSTTDMVNRLEPASWRWIESSPAEQAFLGWSLADLRQKSFLDVIDPDDRARVQEAFAQAMARGEALGLVVQAGTASGQSRSIEINAGARYGTDQRATHLRCHLTDVTEQVQAERELRRRTLELTRVNEQLRRINRELKELKDRYSDLYENAPAMYFSLDLAGEVVECNRTMLAILNRDRGQVVGRPYRELLGDPAGESARPGLPDFAGGGSVEQETRWVKSDAGVLDVWVLGTAVRDAKGSVTHARFVAQDVTARRRLEAELQEKNRRLARANEELSRKNRELDEFVHVVSHDLQEPLRTLIAFSDFLLRDYGDRLEPEGQEFVRYLVDASRRMRAMILGMLNLARAGGVIDRFQAVDLNERVAVVRTDLGELIRSKNAEVRVAGPLPTVWGEPDRIGQLLANLITNGLKYNRSPRPGVEIGTIATAGRDAAGVVPEDGPGDEATITVKDNGIGIDPRFHATIFQLFRRLHTQEEYEGTGAGLAICAKIVQAHGGRIWVESTPGRGATFFIRLRLHAAPAPSPADAATPVPSSPPQALISQAVPDEHDAI